MEETVNGNASVVKQKMVIITEEVTNETARYEFRHTTVDDVLVGVECKVYDSPVSAQQDGDVLAVVGDGHIGTLYMEYGSMRVQSFPLCDKYSAYVNDFIAFIKGRG